MNWALACIGGFVLRQLGSDLVGSHDGGVLGVFEAETLVEYVIESLQR